MRRSATKRHEKEDRFTAGTLSRRPLPATPLWTTEVPYPRWNDRSTGRARLYRAPAHSAAPSGRGEISPGRGHTQGFPTLPSRVFRCPADGLGPRGTAAVPSPFFSCIPAFQLQPSRSDKAKRRLTLSRTTAVPIRRDAVGRREPGGGCPRPPFVRPSQARRRTQHPGRGRRDRRYGPRSRQRPG